MVPDEDIIEVKKWSPEEYAVFVKENMEKINEQYSREYIPYEFIVDTDYGSTEIQNLINPQAVSHVVDKLGCRELAPGEKLTAIQQYVGGEFEFSIEPAIWQNVDDTIRSKRGDCKSLSLLFMSLLISADMDAYACISNGHMWVNVFHNKEWVVVETDTDPMRRKIYEIPGFYEMPLYRVFLDHTEKRKKE